MDWWEDLGRESKAFVLVVLFSLLLMAVATVWLALRVTALSRVSAPPIPAVDSQATEGILRGLVNTQVAAVLTAQSPSATPTPVAATPTAEPDHEATQQALRGQVRAEVLAMMTEMATSTPSALPTEAPSPNVAALTEATATPTLAASTGVTPLPTQAAEATAAPAPKAAAIAEKRELLPDLSPYWVR